jgi:chromosome segregation ATPase
VPEQAARGQELEKALETYRGAAKEAEARWLEQRSALLEELQASQARCAELEAGAVQPGGQLDGEVAAVRREAAEADARNRTLREELMAELQASRTRGLELGRALQLAESARARAEEELEAARRDPQALAYPRLNHRRIAARRPGSRASWTGFRTPCAPAPSANAP